MNIGRIAPKEGFSRTKSPRSAPCPASGFGRANLGVSTQLQERRRARAHLLRRFHAAIAAKLLAPLLGRGESCLGARRDHAGLELCHRDHLLKQESTCRTFDLWRIRETDVDAGLEQLRQERDRTG